MKKIERKLSFDKKTIAELSNEELKSVHGGKKDPPIQKPETMGTEKCIQSMRDNCDGGMTRVDTCCQPAIGTCSH